MLVIDPLGNVMLMSASAFQVFQAVRMIQLRKFGKVHCSTLRQWRPSYYHAKNDHCHKVELLLSLNVAS